MSDVLGVRLALVMPPTAEPLTLAEVKTDREVSYDDHDGMFSMYIQAVREQSEAITGRSWLPQVWRQMHPCAAAEIELMRWPVTDIQSVTIDGVDVDHVAMLASGEMEFLAGDEAVLCCDQFRGRRVVIDYGSGYESAALVPSLAKKWMLCKIGSFYELRESEVTGTQVNRVSYVDRLLESLKVRRFA